MPTETTISLAVELPEDLHNRVRAFLDANPAWHYDDFAAVALATLLIQLGDRTDTDVRLYLDQMFYRLWSKDAA